MSESYFLIKIEGEDEFNLCDKIDGLTYLGPDYASSSPQFTNTYQDVSGRDGSPFIAQTLAKRTFNEKFTVHFNTWDDFLLVRTDIYSIFGTRKLMRIRTDSTPAKVYFGYVTPFDIQPYKAGGFDAEFTIPFDVPSGYRYSMYRSDAINNQKDWQFGMNIPIDPAGRRYHFTENSFKLFNASDIAIDPYYQKHDLKIITKFNGNSLKITNKTTNTEWQYNENNDGSKTIVLDGITTFLDGNNVSGKTDFGNLTLAKGWNDIECTGASSVDVTFSFPFIYLL